MTRTLPTLVAALAALLILSLPKESLSKDAAARDWTATVKTVHYGIDGGDGLALYRSIGENGPTVGIRRAIARTDWELLWHRDYVRQGNACRLTGVRPFLTITYTLPRPRAPLDGALAARWQTFIDGIVVHEKVHGELIRQLTDDILAQTAELVVENDPGCEKTRAEVQRRALAAHARYKEKNRAFEQSEMAPGGNVHQLVLGLVD